MRRLISIYALPFVLALSSSACVTSARYDAAVKNAERDQSTISGLQRRLGYAMHEETRLRSDLGWLGTNATDTSQRLEELRRAEAAAETRVSLCRDVALRMQKMVDAGDLAVALRDGRMVLQLPNDVLFESGQIAITPRGQAALQQIASVLKTIEGRRFQVAGHTDNLPIATGVYPSNWELAAARGVQVVRFLITQHVPPTELAAAGYGEFDPIAPNTTPEGRARNRRIEITLQPNVDEFVTVPQAREDRGPAPAPSEPRAASAPAAFWAPRAPVPAVALTACSEF
jgi:chemotaxis protein MotB